LRPASISEKTATPSTIVPIAFRLAVRTPFKLRHGMDARRPAG